jgi:hypothetical protein
MPRPCATRPATPAFASWFNLGVGRGAGSCLGFCSSGDTFRRPVRRFLPATSISLRRRGLWTGWSLPPASCEPGETPQTPRDARPPPCVPHRHIRRPVGLEDGRIGPTGPPLPPCRRRETSFREALRGSGSRRPIPRSAVPASLPRLTAYPRRDGRIVGTVLGDGENRRCGFSSPFEGEETISTS